MQNSPDGAELLRTARTALLEELLPQLPAEMRYTTLMVANAMAIAAREADAGDGHRRHEHTLLRELLEAEPDAGVSVGELNRRLASELRAGTFDRQTVRVGELLLEEIRDRLRISNPKYLKAADLA